MIADLLTHPEGQEVLPRAGAAGVAGQSTRYALEVLKDVHDSLLVGVFDCIDRRCLLNPPSDTVITNDNELLVVRDRPLDRLASH